MGNIAGLWLGLAGALLAALLFALYRRGFHQRKRRIIGLVEGHLAAQHGQLPSPLHINCSDDDSWPMLVSYTHPRTGSRHRAQFACWGPPPGLFLLSEVIETRPTAP
jgi:hypothetical protein